jgi:hypothetical protein
METTETLYTIRLNEEDAQRVVAALRSQARYVLKVYTDLLLETGNTVYTAAVYDDYGLLIALADDIEFVLPE